MLIKIHTKSEKHTIKGGIFYKRIYLNYKILDIQNSKKGICKA